MSLTQKQKENLASARVQHVLSLTICTVTGLNRRKRISDRRVSDRRNQGL